MNNQDIVGQQKEKEHQQKEREHQQKERKHQNKYEYYASYVYRIVIALSIFSIGYYISDCMIYGRVQTNTIIPRTFVLTLAIIYAVAYRITNNYKIMISLAYIVFHGIMWGTIWACYYLPDLSFACVGFFIVQFIFVSLDVAAPISYACIWQGVLFIDIMIANTFLNYPDYSMMMALGIPLYIGTCFFTVAMDKVYTDQYTAKEELKYNLTHDPLTSIYNRNIFRYIVEDNQLSLEKEMGASKRGIKSRQDIYVYMCDIDFFKKVNDTYGHDGGDQVLKLVTQALASIQSEEEIGDKFIRWGGEEFIIIHPSSQEDYEEFAKDMNKVVRDMKSEYGDITISIGVTKYRRGENYLDAINRADALLYKAKQNGRNRYEINNGGDIE